MILFCSVILHHVWYSRSSGSMSATFQRDLNTRSFQIGEATMLRKINFNGGWFACHRTYTPDEYSNSTDLLKANEHFQWFPVEFPHTGGNNRKYQTTNEVQVWWYRKEFECLLSDHSSNDKIYLSLESKNDNNSLEALSMEMDVWIDDKKIFSHALDTPQTSIELTEMFFQSSKEKKSNNDIHTLLLCSKKTSFNANTFLLIPPDGTCTIKGRIFNSNVTNNINENSHEISNYVTSVNDAEESHQNDLKRKNEQSTNEDKQYAKKINNQIIPKLNVVMLIVGTRGDVQPFIA